MAEHELSAEEWWTLKRAIAELDPHLRMGTGKGSLSGSLDPGENGPTYRISGVYETRDTIAAVHFITCANGRTRRLFFRNHVEVKRDQIRKDRCGRAILRAADAIAAMRNSDALREWIDPDGALEAAGLLTPRDEIS